MALAGMVQLVGASSHNQRVVGSIPGQGTFLGCRLDLGESRGEVIERCFSLTLMYLSLPSSLSKSKSNKKKKCPWMRKISERKERTNK